MKKFLCVCVLIPFLTLPLSLFSLPRVSEAGVVLALSGGGTRGFAHLGVIEVLEEEGIPVVGIVGTSIGSLIGALYASGYDVRQMRRIIDELDLPALLSENTGPLFVFTGDDRATKMNTLPALSIQKKGNQGGPLGVLKGDKLFQYYISLMQHVEVTDFANLPIPYAAVATDIRTGEKVVLRSGSLASAMRASMSIPSLFEPWEIGGRLLVDGGLVSNLPVDTARELFPGMPIIGVDVSDIPSKERRMENVVDVLDQSLSIVMRRTTEEEKANADLIVTPDVQEFSFLNDEGAGRIVERGRRAALEHIDRIRELSGKMSASDLRPRIFPPPRAVIRDVRVIGLSEPAAGSLRKQFLSWVGKSFDADDMEEDVKRLMRSSDVATVEYRLERTEDENVVLVLEVRKQPDVELGISGYTTNLNPYRQLYLKGTVRGVLGELDSLKGIIRLGEQWGFDLTYLAASESLLSGWEINLTGQNREMNTSGGLRDWDRYAVGGGYSVRSGAMRARMGLAYEYVDDRGGSENSLGPNLFLSYDTLDIPSDPTEGEAWSLNLWWPDLDGLMYRANYFKPVRVGDLWRTYLRIGYAEGNMEKRGHAVYLGASDELYSVADKPFEAERMAWGNIAFRRVLKRSVLGIVAVDVFGSYGYAMDKNYSKIASPWEVGLSVSLPNNIVDIKLAAMYGSEQFKMGFYLGSPIWDHYPLP